ncbi:MAG: 3'(2'),5'-bisphosphate nucleotidase CysQ [Rhizobiales bacterium]|nr:3'(2'),5'-bisphosphate nucleotidase CysQ [Hyphomicrobiales bacterium]
MLDADRQNIDAALLNEAVREAGALAHTLFRQGIRNWRKDDGSVVSEADIKVDALLKGKLQTARPGIGWLSEETADSDARLGCEKIWIVDPIDGTRSFVSGGSEWCVAAALIERGRPVATAIYKPVTEEFYSAVKGGGAELNGSRIKVRDGAGLEHARVIGNKTSLAKLAGQGITPWIASDIPLLLRLAYVACGVADGALSLGNKNDWDLAAGDLLVHEAGGRTSATSGRGMEFNRPQAWQDGMVAGGPNRHAAMIGALRES